MTASQICQGLNLPPPTWAKQILVELGQRKTGVPTFGKKGMRILLALSQQARSRRLYGPAFSFCLPWIGVQTLSASNARLRSSSLPNTTLSSSLECRRLLSSRCLTTDMTRKGRKRPSAGAKAARNRYGASQYSNANNRRGRDNDAESIVTQIINNGTYSFN